MKILFIIHDLYQEDNHFPFWAGYLAAALQGGGHECESYCMDVYHYSNEELAQKLTDGKYDIICLSFLAARFTETIIPLSKVINKHKGGGLFVIGGHCVSAEPEYILQVTGADIAVAGPYGEEALSFIASCRASNIPIVNKVIDMHSFSSLKKNVMPAYDIFPMDKYTECLKLFNQSPGEKSFGLVTSRGCIGRCSFCHRLSSKWEGYEIESVMTEIECLMSNYGVNYFMIQDELFCISKKRMVSFNEALNRRGYKIKFSCDCRVDLFDEEIAGITIDAGCQFFNFGFESTSQEVLDKLGKNVTVEQNHKAAETAKKTGAGLGVNMLWGLPGDTLDTLKSNKEFILKYNTKHQLRTIRPVTPYPGTELYKQAIADGKLSGPADFFAKFKNSDLLTVNFTDIPNYRFYSSLLDANRELILDYYKKQDGPTDYDAAFDLTERFTELYDGRMTNFRGARHYGTK